MSVADELGPMGCCIRRIDLISTHGKRRHGPLDGLQTFASGIFFGAFDCAE
jgi:hypothetical protein